MAFAHDRRPAGMVSCAPDFYSSHISDLDTQVEWRLPRRKLHFLA